jgi:hypothetical protein
MPVMRSSFGRHPAERGSTLARDGRGAETGRWGIVAGKSAFLLAIRTMNGRLCRANVSRVNHRRIHPNILHPNRTIGLTSR